MMISCRAPVFLTTLFETRCCRCTLERQPPASLWVVHLLETLWWCWRSQKTRLSQRTLAYPVGCRHAHRSEPELGGIYRWANHKKEVESLHTVMHDVSATALYSLGPLGYDIMGILLHIQAFSSAWFSKLLGTEPELQGSCCHAPQTCLSDFLTAVS